MPDPSSKFPLIDLKLEPKSKADMEKLTSALAVLVRNDPNAFSRIDAESGNVILGGESEFHLDCIVKELRSQDVAVNIGAPQVAYRETITRKTAIDQTYKKLTGGIGHFARVIFDIEPNERGAGYEFKNKIVSGNIPTEFVPGVERGLNSVLGAGILAGFPIVDIRIVLTDGSYHEVDSSVTDFEIASRMAFRDGLEKAGVVLLEPIMNVEVTSPLDYLGDVIGDLNSRRGQIMSTLARDEAQIVNALVPLANMFGYASQLNSLTKHRATFTMSYSHYQAIMPPDPDDFAPAIGLRA